MCSSAIWRNVMVAAAHRELLLHPKDNSGKTLDEEGEEDEVVVMRRRTRRTGGAGACSKEGDFLEHCL